MPNKNDSFIPALTGIRAIAAYFVFIHHYNFFTPARFGNRIHLFFSEMHVGVTLFFVLSGLLLCLRYYDQAITSTRNFYNYMVNRFARIYPVLFLVMTINFIVYQSKDAFAHHAINNGWLYYLGSLSFLRGFFAGFYDFFVAQSWSLTVEESFYILCPLILWLCRRSKYNLIYLPIGFIGMGIMIVHFASNSLPYGFFTDYRFLFNFTFFGRCIEFFTGIALAIWYKKNKPIAKQAATFTWLGILVITACVFVLSLLHKGNLYGDYFPGGIVINNLILPIAGIAVLYWGLLSENNWITRLLGSSLFVLLGRSSYIFYLVHVGIFTEWFFKYFSKNPILLFLYLNVLSILIYKLYEHPLNSWLKKVLRK
ncbi:MAG: acyltransferase [Niastella sp.]|nr:acyltransferase [Niastella sp.]